MLPGWSGIRFAECWLGNKGALFVIFQLLDKIIEELLQINF